jgi:hypothetical protein
MFPIQNHYQVLHCSTKTIKNLKTKKKYKSGLQTITKWDGVPGQTFQHVRERVMAECPISYDDVIRLTDVEANQSATRSVTCNHVPTSKTSVLNNVLLLTKFHTTELYLYGRLIMIILSHVL